MGKWWSVLFAAVMVFCLGNFIVAPLWGWWLPEGHSTHAGSVDRLFYVILWITAFFFVLTEAILCIFMWKYASGRPKETAEATKTPGLFTKIFYPVSNVLNDQHKVEMAWTVVPALILLYIAFAQVSAWADVKYQSRMPKYEGTLTPLQIDVSARQFEWRVRYPSSERFQEWMKKKNPADFKSFAGSPHQDDVHVVNEVHVWKDHPVVVHLSSRDVIHSFNLPHLRVKQDALPGKVIPVWFTPTKENTALNKQSGLYVDGINPATGKNDNAYVWDLACAELCGWGHYRMIGRIYVHKDENEFLDWLKKAESQAHSREPSKTAAR
ncbi:MAG: cytochrome c oxidase subunit II [Gemmataceae bacterium]|nr:cytochrome c oxidase subunit II [Gemmataceae bacterium]